MASGSSSSSSTTCCTAARATISRRAFSEQLSEEERVETLWWEGTFEATERVFMSAEELDPYLAEFVARELAARPGASRRRRRLPFAR